jgi:raffinose/stachyose/melibiose transport system substrate-binding protein
MEKSMKKIIVIVTTLIMMISLLTGCGTQPSVSKPDTSTPGTTTPAPSKVTPEGESERYAETVTISCLVDNQSQLDGIEAVNEAALEKFNIKVEFELRPGGADGDNLVKTRLATGEMNDLCFYNSGSLFQALNPEQNFVDMTDEPFMYNVLDSFKPCVSVNGRIYGIPSGSTNTGAWLYNKKVYSELGLSVPKTWDELLDNCEKIEAAGKLPVIGSYQDSWTAQVIVLADYYNITLEYPNFADDFTSNKVKFATEPIALRSWEKLQEIYDKGYINEDLYTTTYETALRMIAEGSGAHYPIITFALPQIAASYPELINDIGLFGQPGDDASKAGITVWMPGGVYVPKTSENIEAALKWCSLYASPEGCAISAAAQLPEGPYAIKGATLPDNVLPAVKDMLPYFDSGLTAPALEFLSPVKGANMPQICAEVGGGITNALEGAEAYDKDCEKQALQLGLEGW